MSTSNRKKERRLARKERNREKDRTHKEQAWESGKLIEENHNQGPYSQGYTIELSMRLLDKLRSSLELPELADFINSYQEYKSKIRDLVIYWNPEVPEEDAFHILRMSLEYYWDKDTKIQEKLRSSFYALS